MTKLTNSSPKDLAIKHANLTKSPISIQFRMQNSLLPCLFFPNPRKRFATPILAALRPPALLFTKRRKWKIWSACIGGLQQDYMNFSMQMSLMENQENLWEHSQSQIHESRSEAAPKTVQSLSRTAGLHQARQRLLAFMDDLHEHRKSEIREDILQHCEQVNKNKKVISSYISDETIVRLVSGRIDKMVKNKKLKKNWSEEDVKILVWVISKYCDKHNIDNVDKQLALEDWERIARLIPGVSGSSCMFKWLSIRKTNLSNCSWATEESQLLRNIIDQQQGSQSVENFTHLNWKTVSEELYFRNTSPGKVFRSSKQCRQHWNCFLNPRLKKGPWLASEDMQLLTLIKNNNGNKKWSEIVYYFEGRTENALKNRYTLLLEKQRRISKSKQEIALIEDCLQRYYEQQANNSGLMEEVILEPIVNFKEQVEMKQNFTQVDFLEKESQNYKSEANTISSSSPTPISPLPAGRTVTKIHYLTSSDQLEFLEWMKRRSDIRRCCLKNGSFQMEDC